MKKSLGNKRVYITDEQIAEIVRVYAENTAEATFELEYKEPAKGNGSGEGEPEPARVVSKVFDSTYFGYRKVTVDRPLRLVFQASEDRIRALAENKQWQKALGRARAKPQDYAWHTEKTQEALRTLGDECFTSEARFHQAYLDACAKHGLKQVRPLRDAVAAAMGFKHSDPEIQQWAENAASDKSLIVADPELRDTENIPLSESIDAYMKREVLPHVPDAWVNETIRDEKDGKVGKVGYEINFNRYFYVYKPPRPPEVIAAEIREMEKRFLELMKGVVA